MYLTGFAKSNPCALLQRSVREPRGRAERKCAVTSVCGAGFQLWVAGLSLPDTHLLSEGRGICVGTWLQPCFKGWPWYSKCLIPPAVFCLLVEKRNSVLKGRCWEIPFQNRGGGRAIRCKSLSFCFLSSAPSQGMAGGRDTI